MGIVRKILGLFQEYTEGISVVTALILAMVAVVGFIWNAIAQRRHEKFKLKIDAYADFLQTLESLMPINEKEDLQDYEEIKKLNVALSNFQLKAPADVIHAINSKLFKKSQVISLGRNGIKEIQIILHRDMHGYHFFRWWRRLTIDVITHFPFKK